MVKIWFVREGPEPTRGGPAYQLPIDICIDKLELTAHQFMSGPDKSPRFGDQSVRLTAFSAFRLVICEIEDVEAEASGWKAGFYRIDFSPGQVAEKLGPPADPLKAP